MKTLFITGASHGIGKAIAMQLADKYECIAICSRNADNCLDTIAHELSTINPSLKVMTFSGDVSDYDFVSKTVEAIISETGSIDTLINNAGISKVGLLMDMSLEEWNEIVSVNMSSVFMTCKCIVPYMVSQKSGKILNISSVWGNVGASCEVAYSATKSGINGFTKALAKELAPSNISVNAIAFGAIDTRMNSHLDEAEAAELAEEIPAGRMASTKEAAQFVESILNTPTYFTGDIIKFDGAWT